MFWDKKGIPRNPIGAIFTLVFSWNFGTKNHFAQGEGRQKKSRIFDHVVYGQSLSLCVCMCAAAALKLPRVIQSRMRGQKKKIEDLL